jgi:hypothetical protein
MAREFKKRFIPLLVPACSTRRELRVLTACGEAPMEGLSCLVQGSVGVSGIGVA